MSPLDRLTSLFERFPGIGPRQAQRFVQYLLRGSPALRQELSAAIQELGGSVRQCTSCFRFFSGSSKACDICSDDTRDRSYLAVVASDADLAALERSGTYRGLYFVLGGTVSLASEKASGLRIKQLLASLPKRLETDLTEIVLAFPANPEGDATAIQLHEALVKASPNLKITALGRGLSTGSELEYADVETIKSAFENRR